MVVVGLLQRWFTGARHVFKVSGIFFSDFSSSFCFFLVDECGREKGKEKNKGQWHGSQALILNLM